MLQHSPRLTINRGSCQPGCPASNNRGGQPGRPPLRLFWKHCVKDFMQQCEGHKIVIDNNLLSLLETKTSIVSCRDGSSFGGPLLIPWSHPRTPPIFFCHGCFEEERLEIEDELLALLNFHSRSVPGLMLVKMGQDYLPHINRVCLLWLFVEVST